MRTHGATIGRMLMGLLFLFSGVGMLVSGVEGTASMVEMKGLPFPILVAWLVVAVKVLGGGALVLGYKTKEAALALILFTLATVAMYHLNIEDPHLFKNLAIVGGLLYVYVYGPGNGWRLQM